MFIINVMDREWWLIFGFDGIVVMFYCVDDLFNFFNIFWFDWENVYVLGYVLVLKFFYYDNRKMIR